MDVLVLIVLLAVVAIGAVVVWRGGRRKPPDATPHPLLSSTKEEAPPEGPASLRTRLGKSRSALAQRFSALGTRDRLGDEVWSEVEDLLISADVGASTAAELVAGVREQRPPTLEALRALLERDLVAILDGPERRLQLAGDPAVILVVGVNGSGKTTSVAKLAGLLAGEGKTVVLGAADTFRAAGSDQLAMWAGRVGVDVISGQDGADPAAVAFDALQAARARGADVLIVDTAGRLQTKSNLMAELGKVVRVLERESDRIDEILLVVDGTTGQNALSQARSFTEVAALSGMVVTKLDGTARGGVTVAIEQEMGVPVKFIGVGEGVDDLVAFEPAEFVDALLGT